MKLDNLFNFVRDNPIFKAEILRVGKTSSRSVNVQICRWKKAGKIIQLRRGLYMINSPYLKPPSGYDLYIASLLHSPSYLSLEKALEYHGIIPESVAVYTSVTSKRPVVFKTPLGEFSYRHVKPALFWGYQKLETASEAAFMALPEKAVLDIFYLNGANINTAYFEELRFQNLENFDVNRLISFAEKFESPGVKKAAEKFAEYIQESKDRETYL